MEKGSPELQLQMWAIQHRISPASFAKATGFSYNHAYQLLRGKAKVTFEVLGRMLAAYEPADVQALAINLSSRNRILDMHMNVEQRRV